MCNNCDYTIHGRHHHFGWDNSFVPTERVAPGSTIEFQCLDSSGGQLTMESAVDDVALLDFAKVNPVTGPIYVEGAEPGDALKITIEAFKPSGFGWTANIPGFGLLADDFTQPALNIWKYDAASLEPALFGKSGR
ncbi:MAG: acetamidase, partial [Mesorhizobium sp.]